MGDDTPAPVAPLDLDAMEAHARKHEGGMVMLTARGALWLIAVARRAHAAEDALARVRALLDEAQGVADAERAADERAGNHDHHAADLLQGFVRHTHAALAGAGPGGGEGER